MKERPGYRPDERIVAFRLLDGPFTIENGCLAYKLSLHRNVVMDRYQDTIDEMKVNSNNSLIHDLQL